MTTQATVKTIVAVQNRKEGEKGFWTDIGSAVVNPNGTVDLSFDAIPVGCNITVQVRDRKRSDEPHTEPPSAPPRRQIVAIITEKKGKQVETRLINLGLAFGNKDGSYTLRFNYFPVRPDTQIQLRDINHS